MSPGLRALDRVAKGRYCPATMAWKRYALILSLALVAPAAAWGQPSLTPQAGILLLRNGHVLEGHLTRAGDYFIVTLGEMGEIRLRASEVEALCGSLDEAYEFKARHLRGSGAGPHLELAEWCLRHRLHARCAEQLVAVMKLEPEHPRLLALERRLELAVETPPPVPTTPASPAATVSTEQLDRTLGDLPAGSVEKFAAVVQPILLNRCGANNCHGPSAPSEFRLLRPPSGQLASRRFTQRNLYATLQQLDRVDPDRSPLLILPQGRHGTALTAVFDKHSQGQLEELARWVKLTVGTSAPPAPPTIGPSPTLLSQPATDFSDAPPPAILPAASRASAQPIDAAASPPGARVMRPALDAPASSSASPGRSPAPFTPRDRYDAEIFNRRFHAK